MTTVPQSIQEQIQLLAPSAIIELYELILTEDVNGADINYYYHDGTNELYGDIIFNSITYSAVPCSFEGFKRSTKGTLPRPSFTVANTNSAISSIMTTYNPLNAQIKRIQTCKKFLDAANFSDGNASADPTAIFQTDDIYYIDRVASENPQAVTFELTSKLDLTNLRLPRRQVLEHCPWLYRGTECGYVGSQYFDINDNAINSESDDKCGHRYTSCAVRFTDGNLPFGGFPGARLQM
jgi:lambda family phage minor tail protein L